MFVMGQTIDVSLKFCELETISTWTILKILNSKVNRFVLYREVTILSNFLEIDLSERTYMEYL